MTPPPAVTRPLRAGLRSAILPGWGQLATGHRAIGWFLIFISVATAGATLVVVVRMGVLESVSRIAHPDAIGVLLVVNVVLFIVRVTSTELAWWRSGGRHAVGAVALAAMVAVPHVALGWVGTNVRSTLTNVFAAPPPADMPPSAVTTTTVTTATAFTYPTTTVTSPTTTVTSPTTTVTSPTATVTSPTATATGSNDAGSALGQGRINILLLGGDAGPGRWGIRTDTVMVASVDVTTGASALFGLPRNFGSLRFTDGTEFPGLILNEVYAWGRDHPDRFGGPDAGATAIGDVATALTGLKIDYFVLIDLVGFGDMIDALGGVTMNIPAPIDGPLYDVETGGYEMIRIPSGFQTLDGDEALAYARSRHTTSDYDRMGRQRCILAALVEESNPLSLLGALPALLEAIESNVSTDIPVTAVPELIRLAGRAPATDIRVIGFGPEWSSGRNEQGYHIPDVPRIQEAVSQVLAEPSADGPIGTAAEACG